MVILIESEKRNLIDYIQHLFIKKEKAKSWQFHIRKYFFLFLFYFLDYENMIKYL